MCAKRCTKVHKGVQGCVNVCEKVCKVHAGAQKAQKGAQVCTEVHGRVRRWGWSPGRVGGWCGCGECRPSAEKLKKKHRNFSKTCLFDRAYCKKLTWSRLGKGSGSGTRPGDGWGVCQLSLEGSGSPGGGGEPEQVRARARKIENR